MLNHQRLGFRCLQGIHVPLNQLVPHRRTALKAIIELVTRRVRTGLHDIGAGEEEHAVALVLHADVCRVDVVGNQDEHDHRDAQGSSENIDQTEELVSFSR